MTTPAWEIAGQYYETCSCNFVCPCVTAQMSVKPTKGSCVFAMAFRIDRGTFGNLKLDGLGFVVVGFTPEEMVKGDWSVGLIADNRASAEQRDAMTAIASGSAGGPMAPLSALIGKFLGVLSSPISFQREGVKWSVQAPGLLDMAAEPAMGINPNATEPIYLENTGHPAANRFALARASKSRLSALGLHWEDTSGLNNGQYAPFAWKSA